MTDEFQFQLSVSLPPSEQYAKGHMINIRGGDAAEFLNNLLAFDDQFALHAGKVAASIEGQFRVASQLGATVVEVGPPAPAPIQAAQAPQVAPQAPPQQQAAYAPQNGYQQQQQPQGNGIPTSPPPHVGPAPSCSHGQKGFIAKPYKNGKPGYWMAWSCPAQRGDQTQHPLEFIDTRNR